MSANIILIISVRMQLSHCKPKGKPRKPRIKTLCTLDTFDANFADSYCRRGKENDNRLRNGGNSFGQTRSATNKKASMQHHQSQFSAYNCSRVRESSNKIGKRAMSISHASVKRVKTDYSEHQFNGTRNISSLKKKLVFPTQEIYKFDCWQVLRTIFETSQQDVLQVYQQPNKKQKFLMIRTKSVNIKRDYDKEMKACVQVQQGMKAKDRGLFLKIKKIFKQKKEWMIVTDNLYHANWSDDQFYMFVSKLKSSHTQLQLLAKMISKAIQLLSKEGYVHSGIGIESIYFPINRGEMLINEQVKLSGLKNSFKIESKETFLSMPTLFRTPPQILNFISFECKQEFDREYLDVIGRLQSGWQIDVWSMGILILQILNGGNLSGEGSERPQLISLQKELSIRYSYLLVNMQARLRSLLVQMLNPDPTKRPHPRQILRLL